MTTLGTGDTLQVTDPGVSYDAHLWIVLSKPELDEKHVLIANLTSWRSDKDQACVLGPGDHPYIRKKTCVNYADSRIVAAETIARLIQSGHVEKGTPVSLQLLERIREGAMLSRFMPLDHGQLLIDQGLVTAEGI
jgi:hypothetical protein